MYKTMRCIFCKQDSSNSKSVEHIIPESLGGKKHILCKGIVCDKCNNYFSREVEKPFLEDGTIRLLRFNEGIESKKGKVPPVTAILNNQHEVTLWKDYNDEFVGHVDISSGDAFESIIESKRSTLIFPAFNDNLPLPNGSTLSRFLGKVAIEAFALRILSSTSDLLDSFIDDDIFDPLKKHVRGSLIVNWPYSMRRIYGANKQWVDEETQTTYQVMNEFDFLLTDQSECYFALALFGMEYAINIEGPSIEGYENWLRNHEGVSPLYIDKGKPGHRL
ncbi:MAG: HNH endonuclease [Sphaerochaetaceae bacterium]|nr:HNH endonuclease [Sphaerochaetaceae bacterium]